MRYDPRRPDELYAPQPVSVSVMVGIIVAPMLAGLLVLGLWLTLWQLVEALTG